MLVKLQHTELGEISLELKTTKRPLKGHDFEIRDSSGRFIAAGWIGGTKKECIQEVIRVYSFEGSVS